MRRVCVEVKTCLIIEADEGINIDEVLENMDYDFSSQSEGADIVDTEIQNWEIKDAK